MTGAFQICVFLLPHPAQSLPPAPSERGGVIQRGSNTGEGNWFKFEMRPHSFLFALLSKILI
jgi:hypothetical protein